MREFFLQLSRNRIFSSVLLAWLISQAIKVGLGIIREKRFNFRWVISAGGMPSAHAAGVMALTISLGLKFGFDSPIVALAIVFAIITMFDAQGVRRAAGRQAGVLNKILDDVYWRRRVGEDRLKELIGHTPVEVIVGGIIGILMAFICYK